MRVISSTDGKYTGYEIVGQPVEGDVIPLGDFQMEIQFVRILENGNILLGNPNYQLQCKE